MLLLPRLGHCFKLATSTYQHPVERCLVCFYWRSLSSADTAHRVGICSFLLAYPKEVHKPISKQNSTEFPAHSASFHTFPSGESSLWLANLRQLYEKGISDKNNQRKFEGFPRWTGGANHHCNTRLLSRVHIMLLLPLQRLLRLQKTHDSISVESALSHYCILTTDQFFKICLELFCPAYVYSSSQNKLLEVKAKQNAKQIHGVLGWV